MKFLREKKGNGKGLTVTRNKIFQELQDFHFNESLVVALMGLEMDKERVRLL